MMSPEPHALAELGTILAMITFSGRASATDKPFLANECRPYSMIPLKILGNDPTPAISIWNMLGNMVHPCQSL
jgi:hypothetical protein